MLSSRYIVACEPWGDEPLTKITEINTCPARARFLQDSAGRYEGAERITLVMDNLNTHKPGSLYETFPPEEAKALLDRFEFIYTPKHGSWLNMAEIELNVLIGQCLNRRIDDIKVVARESSGLAEIQKQQGF